MSTNNPPEFKYDFCIICEDKDYEKKMVSKLQEMRPTLQCIYEGNWKYGKPIVENLIIPTQESRKVIIIFSENPKNENGVLAAYKVVSDMIKDMKLKQARLIAVKFTPKARIPDAVDLFTEAEAWDDRFFERLLESLDDGGGSEYETRGQQGSEYETESQPVQCTSIPLQLADDQMDFK